MIPSTQNPFKRIPKLELLKRRWKQLAAVAVVGMFLVGLVSEQSFFQVKREQKKEEVIPTLVPTQPESRSFIANSVRVYFRELRLIFTPPGVCLTGSEVNDFQRKQCEYYWEELGKNTLLVFLPLLPVLVFWLFLLDQLGIHYRKASRALEKKKPMYQATVTNPALRPQDDFCWKYCLNGVSVEVQKGQQVAIYIPYDAPVPLPGEKVLVYEWGQVEKKLRYTGILYAPHMAIVSGIKE